MAWNLKTKISLSVPSGKILTPDGLQILVGSSEDEVLIWSPQADEWNLKQKTAGTWSFKTKIQS